MGEKQTQMETEKGHWRNLMYIFLEKNAYNQTDVYQLQITNANRHSELSQGSHHVSLEGLLSHWPSYFTLSLPSDLSTSLLSSFSGNDPNAWKPLKGTCLIIPCQCYNSIYLCTHFLPILLHHQYFHLYWIILTSEQMGNYFLMGTDLFGMMKKL